MQRQNVSGGTNKCPNCDPLRHKEYFPSSCCDTTSVGAVGFYPSLQILSCITHLPITCSAKGHSKPKF